MATITKKSKTKKALGIDPVTVSEYYKLDQKVKELSTKKESIRKLLLAQAEAGKVFHVGEFTVEHQVTTSERFDSTAFKAAFPVEHREFCKPSDSHRLTVKKVEG